MTGMADLDQRSVEPVNYHLSLSNLEYGGAWKYDGIITIDATVVEPTKCIVVNAKDLDIQSAGVFRVAEETSMSRRFFLAAARFLNSHSRCTALLNHLYRRGCAASSAIRRNTTSWEYIIQHQVQWYHERLYVRVLSRKI
jgi:hypothetical protein